ncbi:hypothetical protein F5Y13DRAFT_152366 [Hypoxylon sp. FL1857]|nr:hypothetical protein F5Y13DRAFT_152366 [Hypoxylon sp. FL1857]
MFNIKVILIAILAILALLAVNVIAEGARVRFQCVGHWYQRDHHGHKLLKREPKSYQTKVADIEVMDEFVRNFESWSNGAYTCKKSKSVKNLYNVEPKYVGKTKNDATNQVSAMLQIINAHKNDRVN